SSSPPRQRASRSDERQQSTTAPCTAFRPSRSLGPLLKQQRVILPRRALKRVARPATSYGRLWNGAWPRVGLHRLPVLDEPIDGPGFRRCMHTDVGHSAAPKPRLRVELLKLRCIAPISLDTKVSDTCRVPKEKRRDGKEVDIERRAAGPDRVAPVEQGRACRADRTTCRDIRADAVPVAR